MATFTYADDDLVPVPLQPEPQVHGMTRAERRLYYQSLFPNSPPEGYAPLKQPKAQNSILSSSQPTIAVHAQAETRQPHGAQAQDDHPQRLAMLSKVTSVLVVRHLQLLHIPALTRTLIRRMQRAALM
ncbi:hypothetical protein MRX96_038094 [Rhipicephalus microplus]